MCELMTPVPRQPPDFLSTQVKVSWNGQRRWRNQEGDRIWEWDSLHGHVEGYTRRGRHVGVFDAQTGERIGNAVPGRRIDV